MTILHCITFALLCVFWGIKFCMLFDVYMCVLHVKHQSL